MAENDSRIARTMSGNPMIAAANAAPVQRNANTMPNQLSSQAPIGPWRPNSTSKAKPTTTGGSTNGRCTTASSSVLPGNSNRARRYATPIATGRLKATLTSATLRLSRMMPSSSALRSIRQPHKGTKPYFSQIGRAASERRKSRSVFAAGDRPGATSAAGYTTGACVGAGNVSTTRTLLSASASVL